MRIKIGGRVDASLGNATRQAISNIERGLSKFENRMKTIGKVVASVTAGLAGAATVMGSNFEAQMKTVQAISGSSEAQLDILSEKAKEMGIKTVFSATEAGKALEYMAMAGWKTADMTQGISGIMNLAAASGEDLAMVSDIVTDALTAFGLKASDSAHFSDVLAAASSNSNTNVAMLGESFKYVAPVAGALGYKVEDVATGLGLMANQGIKAGMSGRAMKNILSNMTKPTKEMAAAMQTLGVSLTDD
ncbi:MAG: phage tail tape measure protein, partial [Lachnoanaerobaculum sp.]|nr:phage tail tape measure protein [Lachnoanaerobaculum sp.]